MQFLHVAGPEENYKRTPYSDADNALISDAKARGLPSVRVNDVVLPSGKVLRFEVRFQTETSVAGSRRTEQTWGARGSPTGMAQVNIDNENTRMVESILPDSVSGNTKSLAHVAHTSFALAWHKIPCWQSAASAFLADLCTHAASHDRLSSRATKRTMTMILCA